jgi:hypothetical protein
LGLSSDSYFTNTLLKLKCAQNKDLHYAPAQAENLSAVTGTKWLQPEISTLRCSYWEPMRVGEFFEVLWLLGKNPKAAPFEALWCQNSPGALSRAFDPRNAQPIIHSAVQPPSIE